MNCLRRLFTLLIVLEAYKHAVAAPSLKQEIVVNTSKEIYQVSDKFLSVAFGTGLLQEKWIHFDFSSSRLFTLARGLAPAYVRYGIAMINLLIYMSCDVIKS